MGQKSFWMILFLLSALLLPFPASAKRDLQDEIQDFTVAERAFQDKFYDVTAQELEEFLEYYPHSKWFGEAKLLLGRSYLELNKPQSALTQFAVLSREKEYQSLKDQALYWSAETYLRVKDYKTTDAMYQDLMDRYPDSAMIPYTVYSSAWSQEAQKKFKEAEALYSQFILRFPDHTLAEEAHVRRVVTFLRQRKFEETFQECDSFLKKYPDSSFKGEILYLRAEVLFEEGNFKEAIASYEKALQEKNEKPWQNLARLNEGWSYFKIQKTDQALSLFQELSLKKSVRDAALFGIAFCERAKGNSQKAVASLRELTQQYPNSDWASKAILEKAEIEQGLSQFKEAAKSYRGLLERDPSPSDAAQAHYGLGWALVREGETEEAISEFQKVSQDAPEIDLRVEALCRIGDIFQDRHRYKQAVDTYASILKEYSFVLEADYAAYQIAVAYMNQPDTGAAIGAYEDFLEKFPKSIYRFQAQYDLGMCYFQTGRFEESKSHFQKVEQARPTEELYFLSLFQIGNCLYNLRDYGGALTVFEEMGSKAPERLAVLSRYEIGWCFYQMGKRDKAVQSFEKFLIEYPDSDIAPDIHFWLADYYDHEKNYPREEDHFKILFEKFPKSSMLDEILFRWSGLLVERGDVRGAIRLLAQLDQRFPGSSLMGEVILKKSELLFLIGKKKEGKKLLYQLAARFPQTPFGKNAARRIGTLLKEKGDNAKAIRYLERAKTGDEYEPNAQIQFEVGECYQALGEDKKALEEFLRVAYLYPKSTYWVVRANLKAGSLFEKEGKWEEAVQTYEKLSQWGRIEEAEIARERLNWIRKQILTVQKTQ